MAHSASEADRVRHVAALGHLSVGVTLESSLGPTSESSRSRRMRSAGYGAGVSRQCDGHVTLTRR